MNDSIIKLLNLKEEDIDNIDSISSFQNEDFLLTLKVKNHVCPKCGSITKNVKDYRICKITHKIFVNYHSIIYYNKRRYHCSECGKSFYENNPFSSNRKKPSPATIVNILNDLKPYNSTFSSIAKKYDLSVTTIIDIFDKHVQIKRKQLSEIMCWDEFYFNRHSKHKYAFIMMNFKNKTIIDIQESRWSIDLSRYFHEIPLSERIKVRYIIIDMYQNYKDLAKIYFKKAVICIDPFHATKKVNDSLNTTRKRIMRKYKDEEDSINYKLLKYHYELLLKNRKELEFERKQKNSALGYSITERDLVDLILDINPTLKAAYQLKEKYIFFSSIEESQFISKEQKETELSSIIQDMFHSNIHEFQDCAKTLKNWQKEILNSFVWVDGRRLSNGPIEGKNTYIKKIISNANGLNNFERARNKFLYSQNLYETFSYVENETKFKRQGVKRGPYKKKKQ